MVTTSRNRTTDRKARRSVEATRIHTVSPYDPDPVPPPPGAVRIDAEVLAAALVLAGQPIAPHHRLIGQRLARQATRAALGLEEQPEVYRVLPTEMLGVKEEGPIVPDGDE
jgi:hypothetical protein